MPRIPDEELDRLKRETDLAALVRSRGVELRPRGKDLVGRCPFHGPDEEPSFVVTPAKGLWHCFGCGASGSVLDFVMQAEGVSLRHAAELLRSGMHWTSPTHEPGAVQQSTVRRLPCPLEEAATDADVIYTDVWASMGQEAEREERLRRFVGFQVDSKLMGAARPSAIFMHCLPAHRGEEVAAEVIDGPQSVVFDQAENRLHAQKAVMIRLMGRRR